MLYIFIEKYDGLNAKNKILKDKISALSEGCTIFTFTKSDYQILKKINSKYQETFNIINSNNYIKYENNTIEKIAVLKEKKIINNLKSICTNELICKLIPCIKLRIYYNIKNSFVVRKIVKEIFKEINKNDLVILIGKKNSVPYSDGTYIEKEIIYYKTCVSYWVKYYAKKKFKKYKLINTENKIKKYIFNNMFPFLIHFYRNFIYSLYFCKKNKQTNSDNYYNNSLFFIRGETHEKLLKKLLKNLNISTNIYFLYEKKWFFNTKEFKKSNNLNNIYRVKIIINFFKHRSYIIKKELKTMNRYLDSQGFLFKYYYYYYIFQLPLYFSLLKIIKENDIDICLNFEEQSPRGSLFSTIGNEVNCKTVTIQHGFIVNFDYTTPLISNERWVWGKYFKNYYINNYNEHPNRIKNIGTYLFAPLEIQKIKKDGYFKVLLTPEYFNNKRDLIRWIENVLFQIEENYPKMIMYKISLHPSTSNLQRVIKEIKQLFKKYDVSIIIGISEKEIKKSDIVICGNTTVGFEAAILGKRVIYYSGENNKVTYEYAHHSYIALVKRKEKIACQLNSLLKLDIRTLNKRREKMLNNFID